MFQIPVFENRLCKQEQIGLFEDLIAESANPWKSDGFYQKDELDTRRARCYAAAAHVSIAPDNECRVLDPVPGPVSEKGQQEKQLGRAVDYVTALSKRGAIKIYELESDQRNLEVQLPGISAPQAWLH